MDRNSSDIQNILPYEDTAFHLLKLFCGVQCQLAVALMPVNSTHDMLDYRLSWHLYDVLKALDYPQSPKLSHILHMNFISQLEMVGLWQWAIYIAMHLELEDVSTTTSNVQVKQKLEYVRRYAIKELLCRHISLAEDDEAEKFLVEILRCPASWIYEAKV